ncbi:MAG: carboxypeptidase-like regulatory domain-containing protein, partial [Cytophagaceae bacterium]
MPIQEEVYQLCIGCYFYKVYKPANLKQRVLLIWGLASLTAVPRASHGQQAPTAPAANPRAAGLTLTGTVRDALGQPLELVVVSVEGQPGGATTTAQGTFTLRLTRPVGDAAVVLVARRLGYQPTRQPLRLPADAAQPLRLVLQPDAKTLTDVTVRARAADADSREQVSLVQLDPTTAKVLPSPFGDFNAILKTLPGVVSNNELSSTYNVRGGNYEENLLYVNGFEVY